MAVFRITSRTNSYKAAKATIRYIMHRREQADEKISRELFSEWGRTDKQEAYAAIDQAVFHNETFFRIVISPDPKREDIHRDLNLHDLIRQTFKALQAQFPNRQLVYFAAIHEAQTDKRHIHALLLMRGRLTREQCSLTIAAATDAARQQRRELDHSRTWGAWERTHHSDEQIRSRRALSVGRQSAVQHANRENVVTARQGRSDEYSFLDREQPVCPNAGLEPHEIKRLGTGRYWCVPCREMLNERALELTRTSPSQGQERGLELELGM